MSDSKSDSKRGRKLRAPAVSLSEAVDKSGLLYAADATAGSPRDAAFKHLGYKGRNGASVSMLTSLEKFGLTREDNGRIFPTNDGILIHLRGGDPEKRRDAIRRSALKPELYRFLWDKYAVSGSLPSDATLKTELVSEMGFMPRTVDTVIRDFRDTIQFAGLRPGENSAEKPEQSGIRDKTMPELALENRSAVVRDFSIPRRGQRVAVLRLEYPVTKDDIALIGKWLALMGETIAEEPAGDKGSSEGD